jgi:hypothetical protein
MAIKTIEDLKHTLHEARWFSSLGTFPDISGFIPIRELSVRTEVDPSGNIINPGPIDEIEIPFPTTQGEDDPIRGNTLISVARQLSREEVFKQTRLEVFRLTLISLRPVGEKHPILTRGPVNWVFSAKGAALYAARQAAGEIVVDMQDFWCSLIPLYAKGHWPKGLASNGDIVIF